MTFGAERTQDMSGRIESPCINICQIAPEGDICLGCLRSLDEIAAWGQMSPDERRLVMADLPRRKALRERQADSDTPR